MKTMIVDIIHLKPQLQRLSFYDSGFSGSMGDEICAALTQAGITTLTFINLICNPDWFASEEQCTAWAAVFRNQTNLGKLYLDGCKVSGTRQATIKAACSKASFWDWLTDAKMLDGKQTSRKEVWMSAWEHIATKPE